MQTRFLFLIPVLVGVAGCSEKIEAQEDGSEISKAGMPREPTDEADHSSTEPEIQPERGSPADLD